jgi:hypothetical protein
MGIRQERMVRAIHERPFGEHFKWRMGAILFRAILAAIVVLLSIQAAVLREAGRPLLMVFAALIAAASAFALFSWRATYGFLIREFRPALPRLSSRLKAEILIHKIHQMKARDLTRLLTELEARREFLGPLLEDSPEFREFAKNLMIILLRGKEAPLATLVFSEALTALGVKVKSYENLQQIILERSLDEFREMGTFKHLAVIFGNGVHDQRIHALPGFFRDTPTGFLMVPLFLISQTGKGLFPDDLLYKSSVELHVGLKEYLQRAASLAKRPEDAQFETQETHTPPAYR